MEIKFKINSRKEKPLNCHPTHQLNKDKYDILEVGAKFLRLFYYFHSLTSKNNSDTR